MSTTLVNTGFWIDYNRSGVNRYQILLNDHWAGILTNAVAVWITSAAGPIFNLLIGPLNWLWVKVSSTYRSGQPEIDEASDYADAWGILLENVRHVGGGYVNLPLGGNTAVNGRIDAAKEVVGTFAFIIFLLSLPVALIVASILSAGLVTDSIALFGFLSLRFEHRAEAQAGSYASSCYGSSPIPDHCTIFYNQSISYSVEVSADCPFEDYMCENGAVKFTTGLLSGSVLGINAANPFLFSRTMTCSAVIADEDYVSIGHSARGFDQWEYWYGRSLGDYTWTNPVEESAWEIKGYSTGIHCSEPGSSKSNFVPLPELTAGPYPVTLMFISSHSIMYPQRRTDPVFSAQTQAKFPTTLDPPLYFNNSTRAGVLGCVDQYQICKSITGPCWTNGNATSIPQAPKNRTSTEEENVANLLLLALDLSTACGSTQFRGAEALDAQTKIAHMQSLDLPPEQWQVEAEKFMQTSLARIQLNAYDIVRGTASSFDGYADSMPNRYRGICKLVEIQTVGWKNMNLVGLTGTVVGVGVLWIISRKRKDRTGANNLIAVLIWRNFLRRACFWTGKQIQQWILEPGKELIFRLLS